MKSKKKNLLFCIFLILSIGFSLKYSESLKYKRFINLKVKGEILRYNSNFEDSLLNRDFKYISEIHFTEYIDLDMIYLPEFTLALEPIITKSIFTDEDIKKLTLVNEKLKDVSEYIIGIKEVFDGSLNSGLATIDKIQKEVFMENSYNEIIEILSKEDKL